MLAVSVCCTAKIFLHIFFTPLLLILLMVAAELMRIADTIHMAQIKIMFLTVEIRIFCSPNK
jgi:hypothetical protein